MSENQNFMRVWQNSLKHFTSGDLKLIACGAMLLSHLAQSGLIYQMGYIKTADLFMLIGRISMPLFCFILVQGIILSKNRKKYLNRILIFALISEIPFDLVFSDSIFNIYSQNVFFSLFFGGLMIYFWELVKVSQLNKYIKVGFTIIIFAASIFWAEFFMADYDTNAIIAIGLIYFAKDNRILTILAIIIGFLFEASVGGEELIIPCMVYLSIPCILLYNGKRGTYNKWYFYGFYPIHLLVIYLLKIILI